jgi:hypothetical protein
MPEPRNSPATFARQSPISAPGRFGPLLDDLPTDLPTLRETAAGLVFHYRGGGDHAANGITPERLGEIDSRYTEQILQCLTTRADRPLNTPRTPAERVVGCCRDFALLLVTLARYQGIPARSRVGFAGYLTPDWFIDHVVAEVWDGVEGRWRLVEAQLPTGFPDAGTGLPLDVLDLPRDRFLTGPSAWKACRTGRVDPARFVVSPELEEPAIRSWPYLAHNLVHDLAALNRREMVLWDDWGVTAGPGPYPPEVLNLLDRLAEDTAVPDPEPAAMAAWLSRPEFRIPPVVTSYSPAGGGEPRKVTLRNGVATM